MNTERIKEILEQATRRYDRLGCEIPFAQPDLEKFAELIIRECAKSANYWYQNHDKIHSDPMSYVLAHFGVEE